MATIEHAPVGILCHGQLARMTGEAAKNIGIKAIALGPGINSSASHAIDVVDGDFNNPDDVRAFATHVGSLVLDTDHVRTEVLHDLHAEGLLIVPNPNVIRTIQNRIHLKEALNHANVPTADWMPAASKEELDDAFKRLGEDVVIKTAEQGFDGRGNRFVADPQSLDAAWSDLRGSDLIVERRLEIQKELAMMLARDVHGNTAFYPLVESVHEGGMLEYVFLPALVDKKVEEQALALGKGVLDAFEGPALIGLEMMQDLSGEIVVNEIAGRPHNTGHYTIEACQTSQFENLVRIATRDKLGSTDLVRPDMMVMMRNLNGGTLEEVTDKHHAIAEAHDGNLHWYNKSPRPRRKRGHLTLFGSDRQTLTKNADSAIKAMHFFS